MTSVGIEGEYECSTAQGIDVSLCVCVTHHIFLLSYPPSPSSLLIARISDGEMVTGISFRRLEGKKERRGSRISSHTQQPNSLHKQ